MITFRTVGGRVLDLDRPSDITLQEIACGLSRICRYTGQIARFYSVAQHSNLVASLVDPDLRGPARLHDAAEAILGDVSRNLKHSPYMQGYRILEQAWTIHIEHQFDIVTTSTQRAHIKAADDLVAIYERSRLREFTRWVPSLRIAEAIADKWISDTHDLDLLQRMADRLPESIPHLSPYEAEKEFLIGVYRDGIKEAP